jgi:hypothetical protein
VTDLEARVARALDGTWTPFGYSTPHGTTYPHQWLWDSCFHSLVWAALGDEERALTELASVFRHQAPSGFVPHMSYDGAPDLHASFWGRRGTSAITQPPVYGHAVAELTRRGIEVPRDVVASARAGLAFLLQHRRRVDGLVTIVHPWESGGDDSPRWDHWFGSSWDADTWFRRKGDLVASIALTGDGSPIGNEEFPVASAGFNALVAFGALELASVTGDERLHREAHELVDALDARWSPGLETWTDGAHGSGGVRTAYDLLGHLVVDRPLPASLFEPDGFGTAFGPAGVHVAEPSFAPGAYWRGSVWPQVLYLLVVAAGRRGQPAVAERLRHALRRGVVASDLAEHWDAVTGAGLGARPQGWAGLTIVAPPLPDGAVD